MLSPVHHVCSDWSCQGLHKQLGLGHGLTDRLLLAAGLDSSNAAAVVDILAQLASSGTTVILSIHQPRPDILRLMTRMVLLSSNGQVGGARCVLIGTCCHSAAGMHREGQAETWQLLAALACIFQCMFSAAYMHPWHFPAGGIARLICYAVGCLSTIPQMLVGLSPAFPCVLHIMERPMVNVQ